MGDNLYYICFFYGSMNIFDTPKSTKYIVDKSLFFPVSIFSGFRSLCTMPLSCTLYSVEIRVHPNYSMVFSENLLYYLI